MRHPVEQQENTRLPGHDNYSLGPSDSSDSGSDVRGGIARAPDLPMEPATDNEQAGPDHQGQDVALYSDTDATGTGERASALPGFADEQGQDIGVDRIIDAEELWRLPEDKGPD